MNQTAILIPDVNIQNIFPHLHIFTILIKLKIKFHPNTVDILEIHSSAFKITCAQLWIVYSLL